MPKRKDSIIIDTNLWISFLLTGDYSKLVKSMVAYKKKGQEIVPVGLDELPAYAESADNAQAELYMKFAQMERKELLLSGATAYWRCFAIKE